MAHFEREFWQATVHFGEAGAVGPADAARFLNAMNALELGEVQWQLPAMMPGGGGVQFEVGPAGLTPIQADFVIGTSPQGWVLRLSARQLIVRHQEMVVAGRRQLRAEQFPDQNGFSTTVIRVLDALPHGLVARRTSLAVNYAMFTADIAPASVLSEFLGRGARCAIPPPDGVKLTTAVSQLEFETVRGRRYAWNDVSRVGNWFGPDGELFNNAALVRAVDVKTASHEPTKPVRVGPTLDSLPPLSREEVVNFFAVGGPFGLRRVLDRLRASLPEGVEVHE